VKYLGYLWNKSINRKISLFINVYSSFFFSMSSMLTFKKVGYFVFMLQKTL